jgi:hypothetical protein
MVGTSGEAARQRYSERMPRTRTTVSSESAE